ncbi:hypothetical protein KI387_004543, partial [Taxus chinensis]
MDTRNEEEIEEEVTRNKMVKLRGVLQQYSIIGDPERKLQIVAYSSLGGGGKEIIMHPEAHTLSVQEFTNWLT